MPIEKSTLLTDYQAIWKAARESDDGTRCAVAPAPELNERIKAELAAIQGNAASVLSPLVRVGEPSRLGLNDGMILPAEAFPLGTPLNVIRWAALERAPLAGTVRVIVVLVDFTDKHMTQTQAHFNDLFFSLGKIPTKSVREYYRDVTNGHIDITGSVVGPVRLPLTLAQYAHGASGLGAATPNAATMARDAAVLADPLVNFAPFDNDGNGFVDAFIVIHAGSGAEETGSSGDIWSHKWTLDGGAKTVDSTKIFPYLTVPEDSKIGVCCHELGHLLFGFPDLYDTDGTSEGLGNWCLMAAGSWGGGGTTPVHPSAWCKANQGWASVTNQTSNAGISIPDVKSSHNVIRLWKDGGPGTEYFLMENRQQTGFDASLPGGGLLIYHVDESVSTNTNESHYRIALLQADGKRDLELKHNRGDAGDPFPGTAGVTSFGNSSNPSSKSYANLSTCVAVTSISAPGPVMTANVAVKCKVIEKFVAKDIRDVPKSLAKDARDTKLIEKLIEKKIEKRLEKPVTDKTAGLDKGFTEKLGEGKLNEGKLNEGGGLAGGGNVFHLEQRIAALESALQGAGGSQGAAAPQPFIGQELRPDLSQSALSNEEEMTALHEEMAQGSAQAKRLFDTKLREG